MAPQAADPQAPPPVRVAPLGLRQRRAAHWPSCWWPARTTSRPARGSASSWSASRWPTRPAPAARPSRPTSSGPTPPRWRSRSDVDVVVELIGGLHPAHELIESALRAGKPVVTANKAVLAVSGAELAELAAAHGVDLLYEAAVAGAIPVIRPLRESLAGEQIVRVMGIVNGTTNFILTRMEEDGVDFDDALAEAQRLGLAERDPDRRCRRTRRRGQSGDPGRAGLRERRRRRRRAPRGDHGDQRRPMWPTPIAWATRSSSWRWPNWSTAVPSSRSGCTRPWCRRRIRWPRCAARSTRSSSKARSAAS